MITTILYNSHMTHLLSGLKEEDEEGRGEEEGS